MINIGINKVYFPGNQPIEAPISADLYIKPYYGGSFSLIQSDVNIGVTGTVNESPLPNTNVDPTLMYVLRAVETSCSTVYERVLNFNPYCPLPYQLSEDGTYCFLSETTIATPPSSSEMTVAKSNTVYTSCGTRILDPGFNINGTGTGTLISLSNPYWRNGTLLCLANNTTDGPMNRSALWATTETSDQTVGFSVCIDIAEEKTYYIGVGSDNYSTIRLDSIDIVVQDAAAMDAYFAVGGANFKYWIFYPVTIPAGRHFLECIGTNDAGDAAFGCTVLNNTAAEIASATSDGDLSFIFDSADFVGMPVQLGSGGTGYSCPTGYALDACGSPISCTRITTVPVTY